MTTTYTVETAEEIAEKLDILNYLAENGFDFEDLTFDDFIKYASLKALREAAREFFREDPTA